LAGGGVVAVGEYSNSFEQDLIRVAVASREARGMVVRMSPSANWVDERERPWLAD
jgi:hypothetical protein